MIAKEERFGNSDAYYAKEIPQRACGIRLNLIRDSLPIAGNYEAVMAIHT